MRRLGILFSSVMICAAFAAANTPLPDRSRSSAGTKEDLSVMAGKMLDCTNQARIAIKSDNRTSALQDVERAQNELRRIESRAHGATMIPIYQEFVSISILDPVRAEHQARNQTANQGATVHQVAGDYTDVTVSTAVAATNLEAAKTALENNNLKRADQALADVQEGVSIEEVEANMPLSRARENLILARSALENKNYTEASADLALASHALANYATSNGSHAAQAKSICQQIDSYKQNLEQDPAAAVSAINKWWNTLSGWSPYKMSSQLSARR